MMDNRAEPDISMDILGAVSGVLDWWREAGVDHAYLDDPIQWIAPPPEQDAEAPTREAAPPKRQSSSPREVPKSEAAIPDPASWPATLAEFSNWWLAEPWLDDGRSGRRVPPRGAVGAKTMIIVPQPETEDTDSLLSGAEGQLLSAMMAAMGLDESEVYIASAVPRAIPGEDWGQVAARGMGKVLTHHIGLAKPEKLIVFGANILPLIGNDPPQGSAILQEFEQEGTAIPMLAARSLSAMLNRPKWKAGVWKAWLNWQA